jgi:hypothetical protein
MTSSGRLQLSSHICVLERNPVTDRTLSGVWTCCWNVRMDASWTVQSFSTQGKVRMESSHHRDRWCFYSWASRWNITSSGRMQGIQFLWLGICAEFSRNISLKKTFENWLNPWLKVSLFMTLTDECPGVWLGRSDDKLGIWFLLCCRLCRVCLESENSFLKLVTLILS